MPLTSVFFCQLSVSYDLIQPLFEKRNYIQSHMSNVSSYIFAFSCTTQDRRRNHATLQPVLACEFHNACSQKLIQSYFNINLFFKNSPRKNTNILLIPLQSLPVEFSFWFESGVKTMRRDFHGLRQICNGSPLIAMFPEQKSGFLQYILSIKRWRVAALPLYIDIYNNDQSWNTNRIYNDIRDDHCYK